ncbi:ABC transporter ATP-binding protein [Paenibacillus donghaensis]|uniref:ABC transporter ATP-binding protein n=1 Tax=Paenibacillus donghaensis TaxID=414771 RepID=A0A2Z2KNW9_9BACL|nr:ABC transporter ATP-binding protein [Paenibacillus donghaensis]ASA26205.1 ABC transporter ATP-binding protein [Paenibacillus donghaensis]
MSRNNEEVLVQTRKLGKTFSHGGVQQHVLKNLDVAVHKGDFTIIMGSSGSGKSTLLYALSGMEKPTLGEILFEGKDITRMSNDQLAVFRRKHCGFVFQQIHLLDTMSVLDNVLSSAYLVQRDRRKAVAKAKELLTRVGLGEGTWGKFPAQISGGEAQRAGIIRALINEPKVVFADEPTGALNSASGASVLGVLTEVNRSGQSIVMVTHDLKTALRGNRILYLRDGVIVGELQLSPFHEDSGPERQDQLQAFLTELGW